ncbi:hypothetical protein K227x_57950 [Rubripirellula lacrimiformis]|uniref:Uncharacterized protein n=1 Tax=Rubripirellula lacrimiformis TaxID=1930273 RepID=A0A517NJQ8_9BACT|nr:hypothetical protein K227x_57950 [Rubripirellula lacrimiformis]
MRVPVHAIGGKRSDPTKFSMTPIDPRAGARAELTPCTRQTDRARAELTPCTCLTGSIMMPTPTLRFP